MADRYESFVVDFAQKIIRWRWLVIVLSIVLVGAAASGARFLTMSTDYRVWFSEENPQLQAFEKLQKVYTQDDNIIFIIKPAKGTVFEAKFLASVHKLTQEAWKIPFATRVDSLTNFQYSFANGDDLTVRDLIEDPNLSEQEIAAVKAVVLDEPLLLNRIITPDSSTLSVNVTLTLLGEDNTQNAQIMSAARKLADAFLAENPDARVALTGTTPLDNAFATSGERDAATLVPLMYGILLLVMIALLRSFSGTFSTLIVIAFSAVTAMGIAGWLGMKLTPVSLTAPTIILTLAIADSIHILITMFKQMQQGESKQNALVESLRVNFGPIFLTSLTTIIGFMSLNFSDAPPFRDFGNITAMGVGAAWLYSITLLPAIMAVLPVRVKQKAQSKTSAMDRLADFVIARRRPVFFTMTAIVLGLIVMIPRIELNDQFVRYFDESLTFRSDTEFANKNLPGMYQINWSLQAEENGGISDPEFLSRVDRFTQWLRAQNAVTHVASLTDVFKRLNKNMNGDDPSFYKLPDSRNLAAQYLLLFEMSLPYGLDLNNQINVDKSSMRLIVTLKDITTVELRNFAEDAQAWLNKNFPSVAKTEPASTFVMFANISKRNIEGMLGGTLIAFLLISATLMLALKSFKHGLVSLIPNLVPAAMAYGIWSIFVGQVGLASAVTTATSLGIVVDATVHFLSKYMRARRTRGLDAEGAIRYAFSTVGQALWVTSAILIVGFSVLSFSTFKINGDMGMLTAIAITMALIADFLLLPTILLMVDGKKKKTTKQSPDAQPQSA